ncbi:MAG TPA: type I DNA topoisomerase [Clostridiaceae bacterium]
MGDKLVIVESPAKAKTIKSYLGPTYKVEASMGHVRDLPKSQLGVDIENNYQPKYITIRGKGDLLDKLRKAAKKCDKVYLATDPDREGEAISWHLAKVLNLNEDDLCRIEFNEITKNAVKTAIKNPRKINSGTVDAQQARRILDRLVGYEISPILWKKVKWGLSAGRVQSVALKIICDREHEINAFVEKEYWSIEASLLKSNTIKPFIVKLSSYKGKKVEIASCEDNDKIINKLKAGKFVVNQVKASVKTKNPLPPFTTSTLQQDANKKINYSTKRTMSIAQQLYEGIDITGHGSIGLITYMRTDSVRISSEAQDITKKYISDTFGSEYIPETTRIFKSKKNIQDAHEAIRPTYIELSPASIKTSLKDEQYKLYSLIWNRYMASQMASCILNTKSVEVINGDYSLKANGSSVKFDGFMKVYDYNLEGEEENIHFPEVKALEELTSSGVIGKQHFTQPPSRFTEALLVKTLEENGIGRPSTYSPTISTIIDRKYVEREKKFLNPTELGEIINNIVCDYFKDIVDIEFTASMENRLDDIEAGKEGWNKVIDDFFKPFKIELDFAEKEIAKITIEDKVSDVLCDKCGKNMVIKHGRFGDFLACPGYPDCKNTKQMNEEINAPCPKCGNKVFLKRSKKGNKFYGCSSYPNCDFVSWFEPTEEKCPECSTFMVKRFSKTKGDFSECSNKECKFKIYKSKDEEK